MKQLALPLLLLAGLTACGGGGEAEPAATAATAGPDLGAMPWAIASPTAADAVGSIPWASPTPSATEVLLQAASLRLEDLPDHFAFEYDRFTTNEQLIAVMGQFLEELGSLSVTREELDCWGRILGYTANYGTLEPQGHPFSGTVSFQVVVDLFRDSGGAGQYFAWLSRDLSNPQNSATWKRAQEREDDFGEEWRYLSASPISFPQIGDERLAAEMAATVHYRYDPDLDFEYAAKAVAFRSGRAVGTIAVSAVNSSPDVDELEDLVRTLDERMKDALE
jgi:hypothetical protein